MKGSIFGKKMYFFWQEILYYLGIFLNFFGYSVLINIYNEFKYKCLQHISARKCIFFGGKFCIILEYF